MRLAEKYASEGFAGQSRSRCLLHCLAWSNTPMATMILDPRMEHELRAQRAACGGDQFDEVWEGVYMMSPLADNEHQRLQAKLSAAFQNALGWNSSFLILSGTNVSDSVDQWEHNYRCPDVVVFNPNTKAKDCGTHWCGGPDFAVEITSPHDRSRDKFDFYSAVGVGELLIIDRKTWTLELYRLVDSQLKLVATSHADGTNVGQLLESEVLGVTLRMLPGKPRDSIEVASPNDGQKWLL
jgi:Uma2 family endonuclease